MVTWLDYMVEQERRRDERVRAEEERRYDRPSRSEEVKPGPRPRRHEGFLAALGNQLVELGSRNR